MPIEIKNLCFSYNPKDILFDNLNINIDNGSIIGIAGRTGCGKSTLIQFIAGLITPSDGEILIDGENIFAKNYERRILRKKLGIVFQYPEIQLFEQTVEKDIAFALKQFSLTKAEKKDRVKWAMNLMKLDYDKLKNKSPLALSGGEKRKTAIAGVLAINPEYLLLDEPIAGLDPSARDDFMKVLIDLKNNGTTIIMVSHNADCLAEYADRIIVMDNGRIIKDAPPDEVYRDINGLKKLNLGGCAVRETTYLLSENGINLSEEIIKYDDFIKELVNEFKL